MNRASRRGILAGPRGAPLSPTTWNVADKGPNISVSSGDLRITKFGTGHQSIRATQSRSQLSSARFRTIIETIDGNGYPGVGLANSSASMNSYMGANANSFMWLGTGFVFYRGTNLDIGVGFIQGSIIEIVLNGEQNVDLWLDGVFTGVTLSDPLDGADVFPAVTMYGDGNKALGDFISW